MPAVVVVGCAQLLGIEPVEEQPGADAAAMDAEASDAPPLDGRPIDARPIDAASPDGTTPQTAAASCKQLHHDRPELSSGAYWVETTAAPALVDCDMEMDDGGWTIVFYATQDDYTTPPTFQISPVALGPATEVLVALRGADRRVIPGAGWWRTDLPAAWRAGHLFDIGQATESHAVHFEGTPPGVNAPTTLYYGQDGWGGACTGPWTTMAGGNGRICVSDVRGVAYFFWARNIADACDLSACDPCGPCSAGRRFSISIR
jgi:hypothetical protein